MSLSIYWFRNDLRLTDNPALRAACEDSETLALVYVRDPRQAAVTRWGFSRCGAYRSAFRDQALQGLGDQITALGNRLLILEGRPEAAIPRLARRIGAARVVCERIAAPEEITETKALRDAGLEVRDHWQSSLFDPADLPFAVDRTPDVFTAFRQAVERSGVAPPPPLPPPLRLPDAPLLPGDLAATPATSASSAWFAFADPAFDGAEASALLHAEQYFASTAPQSYKLTRNGLIGTGYSTKFSPWLAVGALSARTVFERLRAHEARYGANESTSWILFELLWRDFFRFWGMKHGVRLFRARGLGKHPPADHNPETFQTWRTGTTGCAFVNAGMRELAATGYLSNRLRQVAASYLVHDLAGDWRAGAAWFESQLIDYDVYSNQGNWLYISGRGADPRQGRRFDPESQAAHYDPQGAYQSIWLKRQTAG